MSWSEVTLYIAFALLLLLWWVWVAASRLDRLHRKTATSLAALDNQLVRRASAAAELASSGLLDPVSSVLVGEAAWEALSAGGYGWTELLAAVPDLADLVGAQAAPPTTYRDADAGGAAGPADRDMAESELSRTVREALADPAEVDALCSIPLGAELIDGLAGAWYRVQLARRFHNEAATQTLRMRRKSLVRLLRLSGHAPMPHTVEIDDAWPEAFARQGE